MAKNRSRSLAAIALAVTTSIGMTGTVVAQDPECAVGLWSLPIEAVTPPEGWDWSSLFPTTDGGWWGGFSTAEPAEVRATISFDTLPAPLFQLDEHRLQSDVGEIADGDYFQTLQQRAKQLRGQLKAD